MKYIRLIVILFALLILPFQAFAQEDVSTTEDSQAVETTAISPIITTKSEVEVGRNLIFDASTTELPDNADVTYSWDFGDGNKDAGVEVVHIYSTFGTYHATLTVKYQDQEYTSTKDIFVYKDVVTFFYNGDEDTLQNNITSLKELASNAGIFLNLITGTEDNPLLTEESIVTALSNKNDALISSSVIIGGPRGSSFLSAISKMAKDTSFEMNPFEDKLVIVTTRDPLWIFKRIAQRLVGIISPKELILMQSDPFSTLNFVLLSDKPQTFLEKVPEEDYTRLDKASTEPPILFLSYLITIAITNGVPTQVVTFILFLPVILTLIGFFKLLIGAETIGMFHLVMLILSFFILGLSMGTLVLVISLVVGALMRYALQRSKMLFASKMTLLLTTTSFAMLILLVVGSQFGLFFGIDTSNDQRALLSVFPMILIAMQADKLSQMTWPVSTSKATLVRLFTTYVAIVVAYYIIKWPALETMLLAIPELTIIAYILQYIVGRYTGLRVVEYVRFRELFRHDIEE